MFEAFEQRFASQVRVSILFVGLSGLYMLMKLDAWAWFRQASFWWLDLMVVVWALFALMVFVLEPFFLHRRFHEFALSNKKRAFAAALRFHAAFWSLRRSQLLPASSGRQERCRSFAGL